MRIKHFHRGIGMVIRTPTLMYECCSVPHSTLMKGCAIMNYRLYELACKNNAIQLAIEDIMPPGIYFACLF